MKINSLVDIFIETCLKALIVVENDMTVMQFLKADEIHLIKTRTYPMKYNKLEPYKTRVTQCSR